MIAFLARPAMVTGVLVIPSALFGGLTTPMEVAIAAVYSFTAALFMCVAEC